MSQSRSHEHWDGYYAALKGRAPRPLLSEALARLPASKSQPALTAIDLGCGDGAETVELLRLGWAVVAIDGTPQAIERTEAATPAEHRDRLTARTASFADVDLPAADFIYAGLSLPFCDPRAFDHVWTQVLGALRSGGWFAGHLFGPRDGWADRTDMTFHRRDEVDALLGDLRIEMLHEQDEDGDSYAGPKHWHVFHVIAQKASSADGVTS